MINLEVGKRYIITKSSDDGTFQTGDKIRLEDNGDISSFTMRGWIEKKDVEEATRGMKVKLDTEWIDRKKKSLLDELAKLEVLLI